MYWTPRTALLLIMSAMFLGVLSQNCEKNSYLPKGLACKLNVFIRSEGKSDTNLSAPLGSSFLTVNGQDYSRKSRGINLAVFDVITGRYMTGGVFDAKASSSEGTKLRDFIQNLPNNVILLMAVQETGNANSNLNDAVAAMMGVGVNDTAILDNESFGAVLYKGPGSQPWIKESKNTVGNGPSFVTTSIAIPYGYIPEESIRTPFFNVAGSKFGGYCIQSSTKLNAASVCDKALDGLSTSEWVSNSEGVGAWMSIGFASSYKINKVRILQRTAGAAQSKDVRIDFSDCSTFAVTLTQDKQDFEEFTFSPRIASWVKLTVTSTHTASSNGFKEIQFYYDQYESDTVCDQVSVTSGSTSNPYRLLTSSMALQILSQKPVIILSKTSSASGPRYEIVLDDPDNSNTTYIKRSHDGSAAKQVAVSVARQRVISANTHVHVWLEWKAGRVIVGMGESVLLYYRDEQPLDVKYMFLQSPSSNAVFKVCGRKDFIYKSASSYWPLDKVTGGPLLDLTGSKQGTLHGPYETIEAAQSHVQGYTFLATNFDGTSNWADLGDFKETCVSDTELCSEGITVVVRVNRQGSDERYVISSGGQHTRGFAIYSPNSTTIRVEVRDAEKRWIVDKNLGSVGHLSIGFSWSKSLGLTVVSYVASSLSVDRNSIGEALSSPADETSRLTLGRPNNEMAKYFQGSINSLAIFEYSMTSESLAAFFKGTGISDYTDLCYKDNAVSPSFFYYPGDINPEVLSPSVCREHCGNAYYEKAVVYEGNVCTCTNLTSSLAPVLSDLCTVPCTGNAAMKCGGQDSHMHVLAAFKSTTSVVCSNPVTQEALTTFSVTVQISKPFHDLEKNFLEVGDGSLNEQLSSSFKHAFVAVENFTTTAKAALKNNETGESLTIACTNSIASFLPTRGFSFTCPEYVPTNTDFKCNISFTQGYHVDLQVTWSTNSAATTLSLPDSMVVSLGHDYTARSPAINETSPGMYVFSEVVNKHQGTLVGFQLDVVKGGYLEIKCLSVACVDSTQRFCPSQRACISQNSICEPQAITCTGSSTLSMSSGSCLQGNSDSLHVPTVAPSNFNYKSKTSYLIWVNSGQRNLIALNDTDDVSVCDFFGLLIPSIPSAAAMATSYASQSTLLYSPSAVTAAGSNNGTFVGLLSPQQAHGPQVVDSVPHFQFKVIPHGLVMTTNTYDSEGTYKAKAEYGSNSATNLIHAQNVVSNISLHWLAAYPTKEASNVSLSPHSGTNITYTWIFNTTNVTTSTPWVMHSFQSHGFHSVAVFASNKVSVSYSRCSVEGQERISGLEFTVNGLPTSAEKEITRISWSLQNGSNVNFKIDPGDGSGVRELNDSKVAGAVFISTLNTTYAAAGVYNVSITASNKLANVTISGLITIQEKIANVSTNAPNCMATNKGVNITASTEHGDMMRYAWTINNQTFKTYQQPWLVYTPSKAGLYNLTLVVYNNVSTGLMSCKYIQTKDTVGDVELGPVLPAGIGQPLYIPYKVNDGSDFRISVCYGDGVCVNKNGTEDAEGVAVYSSVFAHNYTKDGDYLVNLTVCNCVGCNSTLINVHVETPVTDPKVTVSTSGRPSNLDKACSAPLYVQVNQSMFMALRVGNGTNVKVEWDYGDGFNSSESSLGPFDKDGMHSNHSYRKAGNYTITAKPYNLNGHEVFTCRIVAEDPILGLAVTSNSPVGFPDGSATVTTVTTDPRPSSPIHCVYVYGDTKTSASLPMSFAEKQTVISYHKYPFKGKFRGSVNCSNAISFFVKPFQVEVQDKVHGSTVKAFGIVPQKKRLWVVGDGYQGPGKQGTIFGRNTDIQLITNSVNGSNLTCSFCFDCNGAEQVIKNSSCGNITHRFTTSGKKEVKVEVKNDVSSETIKIDLTIDDNIDCASLHNDGPKPKKGHHIFTAAPNMVGPNWCCYINYGDSSIPELLVPETSNCNSSLEFPSTLIRFKGASFQTNHTYPGVGEYSVIMECGNRVSECKLESKAVMVQIPCKQPTVTIMDFSPNSTSPTKKMRSVEIEIRSKNTIDCEASLKRIFTWKIYSQKSLGVPINMTGRAGRAATNKEHISLLPRTLQVGVYKVCFTLNMTEVIGVHGTACSYLRIIASPITAEIVGGTEVAVGFNKTRNLDAQNSRDPDTEFTASNDPKLKCYWFCKREGDNYTLPTSVDQENIPAVPKPREIPVNGSQNVTDLGGCFGDGPGRLEGTHCNLAVSTAKMQENTTYEFKVCVVHDDRRSKCTNQKWNIKTGDPPAMAIECHYNCKEKLNPSSKISLSCYCVSCTMMTPVLYYWEISRKEPGSSKHETLTEDQVKQLITTPIDGRSFSIGPNGLKGGVEYKFTCKGSRGKKGVTGFASYERKANSKPINGTCDVTPKTGHALNTTFEITCSGWQDEDQPLLYTYGTARECQGEMTILAPDRRKPSYKVESMMPGPKDKNYTVYVIVHVADKHKAINTSTCIPIKVKEQKLDTTSLGNILNGSVQNLLASGSVNELNQVVSSILSQVNQDSSSVSSSSENSSTPDNGEVPTTKSPAQLAKETEERTKIRTQVIDVMAQVTDTLTNLKDVTQTTKILEQAINDPNELTSEAKEQAVDIFSKMTSTIESKSDNAEPQEVEQAVKAVYEGISNCIDFVAAPQPVDENAVPTTSGVTESSDDDEEQPTPKAISEEQKEINKKLASTITETLENIASLVQNTKRPGEIATVLKTDTMEIELSRERSEDLKNKSFSMSGLDLQTNPEMFPGEDLGGGKEPAPIDSMILTSSKNIYNYDESAYLVKGGQVATIEFKNSTTHESLMLQNLSKPVEMIIDRVSSQVSPVIFPMEEDKLYFIRTRVHINDSAIHVNVYPDSCEYGFYVFIKQGSFPSESNYDYNYTLPHDGRWDFSSNCSKSSNHSSAFKIFLSNKDLNHTAAGRYYIGIKFKPRNATNNVDILPVNFTAILYTSSCMYWNVLNESWKSDGCVVGPKTTPLRTQCLCDHLTSFSSSFFVPPNKIDWNKVKNVNFEDAYVCVSTVLVVFILYFLFLIPARRADRRDAEKTGVSPLPDNDPRDTYCYEIHVHTGFMRGAGSSAEVSVVMDGSVGESDPRVLKDPARKTFRTGGVDAFLMTVPQSLGSIRDIRIWHNNGGSYPSWNLLRVMVNDLQTGQRWWFVCDRWLAVDEGDGKIERILYPATSNELTKFNVLFATEVRKNLTDGHLWFSVVTRPARSTFTRIQRLTCCLSILLCTMLANIMFYNSDTSQGPKGSIKVAGFSFSLAQVSIGITSSLVVFPSNLIVVQLFRKARAKETKVKDAPKEGISANEIDIEVGKEKDEKPKKEGIPHWFVYVAYALALGSSLASAVFVIFYGISYGEEKSAQWLMSMTISFIQDVLISQPIKVFLLASIFALLIKDPNKAESDPLTDANKLSTDEEWLHKNVKDLNEDEKENFKKLITDRPPDEAKLEIARQLRMKEKHMKSIIREIVWYMFFLLIVLTVSYGNRDPATYRVTKYINDIFLHCRYSNENLKFDKVSKINDYWKWMNKTVLPSIYQNKWYNDRKDYPLGFVADTPTDLILAVTRLRQLRVKKDSCTHLKIFHDAIPECNDFYSPDEEDRRNMLPGWKNPSITNTTNPHVQPSKKTAWDHQSGEELKTFAYWGYKATYQAGGYVQELPTSSKANGPVAQALLDSLRDNNWLDRYTRAIFTELSIYNANTNFFCVITLLYEQLPTGGLFNYPSILTLKLYRYVGGDMYFVLSCEIVYLLFTLYFLFRELKMVKKEGLGHLKNPWSMVEVFVTMLSLSLVVLYFVRMKFTGDSVKAMRMDHNKFISFHYTAFLDEWINAMMGLIVFLSFLKIVRLLRFNRRMSLLAQTLSVCFPRIFAFLFIYGMAFFAYAQFACLVFGQSMEGFGTILRSAATLMDTILGKFALKEITDANRLIGPTFFYFYTVTMVFILINMFLSIINDSFAEVKNDVNKQPNEYEIVNFMVHRLKENIGKTIGNAIVPIYKEPKSKLEKDCDTIEEHADSIMHYMRNMTFENMRHTRWFDAETSRERKKKMFKILLEVDWDYFEDELADAIPVFEEFLNKNDDNQLEAFHRSYRYKKLREEEMESRFTTHESDIEEEEEDSSSGSNSDDSGGQSDNDDKPSIEYNLLNASTDPKQENTIPSPAASVRSMYASPSGPRTPILLHSPRPLRSPNCVKAQSLTPVPLASETELSEVLDDVDRSRSATDAELNSFLSEIKSVDDNNIPKYDSDPEQISKKEKKKKKAKKVKPRSAVSLKSKAAWGDDTDQVSRKSPAGSSDKERILPEGAENDSLNSFAQDNNGFEDEMPSNNKEQKRQKKKKKEKKLTLSENLDSESFE